MKNRTGELRGRIADIVQADSDFGLIGCGTTDLILKARKEKGLAFVVDRELPNFIGEARDWEAVKRIERKLAGYKPVEDIEIEENTD